MVPGYGVGCGQVGGQVLSGPQSAHLKAGGGQGPRIGAGIQRYGGI